jgi:hypothetical protein
VTSTGDMDGAGDMGKAGDVDEAGDVGVSATKGGGLVTFSVWVAASVAEDGGH